MKPFFPNLDGLRFFCFLAVFLFHSFYTEYAFIKDDELYKFIKFNLFGNGNLGVNFFFVLSGFLITYLLLIEKNSTGVNIKNFYIRRILRIWPLFYFCVFFGFILFPFLKELLGETPSETANPFYYLFFINNFDFIVNHPDSSVLGVLWSVAIEEQFYLAWPVIIAIVPTRYYPFVFGLIISQSILFRWIYPITKLHEYHTLSCIGDMATGALGAWLIFYKDKFKQKIERLPAFSILILYFLISIFFFFRKEMILNSIVASVERTIIASLFLLVILEQNYAKNSYFKLSNLKWVSHLGKRTYGLYCLHFIGILCATRITKLLGINTSLWQVVIVDTALALGITLLIAEISYRYFERPFLKFKERFS